MITRIYQCRPKCNNATSVSIYLDQICVLHYKLNSDAPYISLVSFQDSEKCPHLDAGTTNQLLALIVALTERRRQSLS